MIKNIIILTIILINLNCKSNQTSSDISSNEIQDKSVNTYKRTLSLCIGCHNDSIIGPFIPFDNEERLAVELIKKKQLLELIVKYIQDDIMPMGYTLNFNEKEDIIGYFKSLKDRPSNKLN